MARFYSIIEKGIENKEWGDIKNNKMAAGKTSIIL